MATRYLFLLALVGLLLALRSGESRTLRHKTDTRSDSGSDSADSNSAGSDSSSGSEDESNSREDANAPANNGNNDANVEDAIPCADEQDCSEFRALFEPSSVTLLVVVVVSDLIDTVAGTLSVADTFAQTLRELNANSGATGCSSCTAQDSTTIRCTYLSLVGLGNQPPILELKVEDSSARPLVVESITFTTVDIPVYGQMRVVYTDVELTDNSKAFTGDPARVEIKLPGSDFFIPFDLTLGPVEPVCTVSRVCRVGIDTNPVITQPPPVFTGAGRIATLDELSDSNNLLAASDLGGLQCPNNT